jgi:hypothetical protein
MLRLTRRGLETGLPSTAPVLDPTWGGLEVKFLRSTQLKCLKFLRYLNSISQVALIFRRIIYIDVAMGLAALSFVGTIALAKYVADEQMY